MTGGGAPGAAGILHCLQQDALWKVSVADANATAVGRFLGYPFFQIPYGDDPGFVPALLQICREQQIDLVLPLVTRELTVLANHRVAFQQAGVQLPVSSAASLEIANDKGKLYQFLQWRDFPLPAFRIVETVDQFCEAVEELGFPGRPVCFKPTQSNGSRGFRVMDANLDETEWLFRQKPSSTYISYADARRILEAAPFPELLMSEYLPGAEYSADCLAHHGEMKICLPRLRGKMVNGISVAGHFVKNETIIAGAERIIRELQLHGNIGLQFRENEQGEPLLLEINPRVQGSISTALGAGVNLPDWCLRQELNLPVATDVPVINWNTHFIRYWSDAFYANKP